MTEPDTSNFPLMAVVEQVLASAGIDIVEARVDSALREIPERRRGKPGQTVAVAVGSRRIDRLDLVVCECLKILSSWGLRPFIVPAMGSHGGAESEGQCRILAGYGITPDKMGVPICADMDVAEVCTLTNAMPLYLSQAALSADHIVLINRIKPHTKFKAPIESGLCKSLVVGLGKREGATLCHRYATRQGFGLIEEAARALLKKVPLLFGLGLLEDGYGRLTRIEAVLPEALIEREKALLEIARGMLGRIFLDYIDLLIVDRIGKDISGIGMDSNVTGRHRDLAGSFDLPPHPKRIFVRDLSEASDGNANGIGLADLTTRRLVERIDRKKTTTNAVTAISPEKAAIPMYFDTDRECIAASIATAGVLSPKDARIVRIRNTADLGHIEVSKALAPEIEADGRLKRVTGWYPMAFDGNGNLMDFYSDAATD